MKVLAILSLIHASSSFASEIDFIQLLDIDQKPVQVSPDSLSQGYEQMLTQNKTINRRFENSDGSVTIKNPRVRFAGQMHSILKGLMDADNHQDGICNLFGMTSSVFQTISDSNGTLKRVQNNELPNFAIKIGQNGKISNGHPIFSIPTESSLSPQQISEILESITCNP